MHSNLIIASGIPGQMKLKYLNTSWKQVAPNNFIDQGLRVASLADTCTIYCFYQFYHFSVYM